MKHCDWRSAGNNEDGERNDCGQDLGESDLKEL